MKRLTNEELEDILAGRSPEPEELDPRDEQLLGQYRATRQRLRQAFDGVKAPNDFKSALGDRIRAEASMQRRIIPLVRRYVPSLAAAAAIIIAVGIWLTSGGVPAYAQDDIYAIHQANLARQNDFCACSDSSEVQKRFQDICGADATLPTLGRNRQWIGSAVAELREKRVGCGVVEINGLKVSIILTEDPLEVLGFSQSFHREGHHWVKCGYRECKMVAVRLGEFTFIAAGETSHEQLSDLLLEFVEHYHATH